MRKLILIFFLLLINCVSAQSYEDTIRENRVKHYAELIDPTSKVLTQEEIDHFEGLSYYEIDTLYRIQTTFTKRKGKRFEMPTSTDRTPIYRRFGYIDFKLNDSTYRLTVYQNCELKKKKEFKNYLFIPFRDATCQTESYGGGRYIDTEIPKGKTLRIDFNKAYNPYCAYSIRYSCPIPPEENTLKIAIPAGEKVPVGYHKNH